MSFLQYIVRLVHLLVKNKKNVRTVHVVITKTEIVKALANVAPKEHTLAKKVQRAFMTVFQFVATELTLQLVLYLAWNVHEIATQVNHPLVVSKTAKPALLTLTPSNQLHQAKIVADQNVALDNTQLLV